MSFIFNNAEACSGWKHQELHPEGQSEMKCLEVSSDGDVVFATCPSMFEEHGGLGSGPGRTGQSGFAGHPDTTNQISSAPHQSAVDAQPALCLFYSDMFKNSL